MTALLAGVLGTAPIQAQTGPTPQSLPTAVTSPTPTPRAIVVDQPTATPTYPIMTEPADPTPRPTATPFTLATVAPTATSPPPPTATPIPPTPVAMPTIAPVSAVRIDFAAADWDGGFYRGDGFAYGRPWVAVYGALSAYPRATLSFSLERPPRGGATLAITGLDDEWAARNEMALTVNGQEIFRGASPFLDWDGRFDGATTAWTSVPFAIPAGVLRAGPNEITVANLTPAASFNSPPYVLLADATLEARLGGAGQPDPSSISVAEFAAADWSGGFYRGDSQFYGRPWVAVYGAFSQYPSAALRFRLDAQPSGPARLIVSGLDDEWAELNPIAVEVNGREVYSGPSPFLNWDGVGNGADAAWTRVTITIPAELLRSGRNEVTIANLTPVANFSSPPYILLAEATLEVPGATVTPLAPDGSRLRGSVDGEEVQDIAVVADDDDEDDDDDDDDD